MIRRRYRLRFRAHASTFGWTGFGGPYLNEQLLLGAFGQAIVHRLETGNPDGPEVDIELPAESHESAVSQLLEGLASLGFDTAHIVVIDLLKAAIQRAVVTGTGGGALGATTKNRWVIALGAAIGSAVGYFGDVAINEAWAMIEAERVAYPNGWRFTPLPPPAWTPAQA